MLLLLSRSFYHFFAEVCAEELRYLDSLTGGAR